LFPLSLFDGGVRAGPWSGEIGASICTE
jgi:hypothetical protein